MSLLNDRILYRDKNAGSGDAPIDLEALMLPAAIATPTSWTITAGNGAGQWAISSGVVDAASSSVAADTYTLTVEATWSGYPAPYDEATATLTIVVPAATVYVDPASGNDTNSGTSQGSPWAHAPGDANVVSGSTAANYNPGSPTLVVIKGGSFIRSQLVQTRESIIYCGGEEVGWGTGPTTYCGADPLGSHATPSSGEVFDNPNVANIKKWTSAAWGGVPRKLGQYLIDRDAEELITWAQWPARGPDKFLDAADPAREQGGGGMHFYAIANIVFDGADSTVAWPEDLQTLMDGDSLVGAYVGVETNPNEVTYFRIDADDLETGTFDCGNYEQDPNNIPTAMQVVGHPKLISGVDQFAWSADGLTIYAWTQSASNIEVLKRVQGLNGDVARTANAVGLTFEGYYGEASALSSGSGISVVTTPQKTLLCVRNTIRWIVGANQRGAGIYTAGAGHVVDHVVSGNLVYDCVRAGGLRLNPRNIDGLIQCNVVDRIGRTFIYYNAPIRGVVEGNTLRNGVSAHGNGFTFYNDSKVAEDLVFRNNLAENVARPLTKDEIPGATFEDSLFEMDASQRDSVRLYASHTTESWSRCAFLRRRDDEGATGENAFEGPGTSSTNSVILTGVTGNYTVAETVTFSSGGSGVVSTWSSAHGILFMTSVSTRPTVGATVTGGTSGATGTVDALRGGGALDHCVFDGVTGVQGGQTITNSLILRDVGNFEPQNNVSPNSGNALAFDPDVWDGTLTAQMKQYLGLGRLGDRFLYGIAVIDFEDETNVPVSDTIESDWAQLEADGTKTLTVTGGEAQIANDGSGTGAGSWAASHSVADGKWVKLRRTSASTPATTSTVTADFGEGNVYVWKIATARASGWPLIAINSSDDWKCSASGSGVALGSGSTSYATILVPLGAFTTPGSTQTIFGQYTGALVCQLQMLTARRLRTHLKDASNNTIARFDTPDLPGTAVDVLITVDMTKASGGSSSGYTDNDGIRIFFDGERKTLPVNPSTWTQNAQIGWGVANTNVHFSGATGAPDSVGGIFIWDLLAPTATAADTAKFTALQMGRGGFTNPLGTSPLVTLVGDEDWWENAAAASPGLNRGSGPKFLKQTGTDVSYATGSSQAWPSYTYAGALSVTGPASPVEGQASTYTVDLDGSLWAARTVTLSDGGAGGTFSPTSLSFVPAEDPVAQAFDYTPAAAGAITLAVSATDLTNGTQEVVAQPAPATAYSLSGPIRVGTPVQLSFALNGANAEGVTFVFSVSGVTGTFDPDPTPLEAGATAGSVTFTPTSAGTAVIGATNSGGLTNPSSISLIVQA